MEDEFAERIHGLRAEGAYRVMEEANRLEQSGRQILHLEIGQPDFPTFESIRQAGKSAIDDGHTRYNPSSGYPSLREAIAENARQRGIPAEAENVVVGPGAKPGLVFPLLALLSPGDEVLYPNPGFPTYAAAIRLAGAVPTPYPLIESQGFKPDLQAIADAVDPKTRMLILNSPSNPTGGIISAEDLRALLELTQTHGLWILSDEIYARLAYDMASAPSLAAVAPSLDRIIVVDGFSKTYSMTGWRLGFAIMPRPLAEKVGLLLVHAVGCTAGFTQVAGIAALRECDEQVSQIVSEYRARRDLIAESLNRIEGISCQRPAGAFYAFPNVSELGLSSRELADRLLREAGVACLPGTDFGKLGEGYLRFSFAAARSVLADAVNRLAAMADGISR